MVAKTSAQMSIETLASLGAERLAEILHEHAHDDPRLLEKLESVLAEVQPVQAKLSGTMLGSIQRRVAALEEADGYHDWRAAGSLGADIDAIRHDIMESVLPDHPESAAGLLEQLVDLEHFLLESTDDSNGEISVALGAVVDDWGRAWAYVANRDAETVAELVFDAFTENDYGVLDEVIPAFEQALGVDGLAALEARFRAALEKEPELPNGEDRDREWNQRMLLRGLEDIADLRGDLDAFIATHKAAETHLVYAVAIAERLHRAGRSDEALLWLERPERQRHFGDEFTNLHIGTCEKRRCWPRTWTTGRASRTTRPSWIASKRSIAASGLSGNNGQPEDGSLGALRLPQARRGSERHHTRPISAGLGGRGSLESVCDFRRLSEAYRGFESHPLRQSDLAKLFSGPTERRKKPLFQRGLLRELGTALPPEFAIFFSCGAFSLRAGYCAILVPSLKFLYISIR